jgi:16S rRNA A1518/A1519 N6-dimethyltransferase RsmA/KsgA/DIM1 with predicted DNA glycosylase/AP lyase activity
MGIKNLLIRKEKVDQATKVGSLELLKMAIEERNKKISEMTKDLDKFTDTLLKEANIDVQTRRR